MKPAGRLVLALLTEPDTPEFARRVPPGPARLLRDLVSAGLDEAALSTAAALVLELDGGGR